MRRTRVALIINGLWFVALAATGAVLYLFGLNWLTGGLGVILAICAATRSAVNPKPDYPELVEGSFFLRASSEEKAALRQAQGGRF